MWKRDDTSSKTRPLTLSDRAELARLREYCEVVAQAQAASAHDTERLLVSVQRPRSRQLLKTAIEHMRESERALILACSPIHTSMDTHEVVCFLAIKRAVMELHAEVMQAQRVLIQAKDRAQPTDLQMAHQRLECARHAGYGLKTAADALASGAIYNGEV